MNINTMLAGGGLALALVVSAQAQTLTAGDVDEVLNAARSYGSATLVTQDSGDPQITGQVDGITYQIYFGNCTNNENCEDLNFYLGLLDVKPTLKKINDWNMNKRFGRAYLDQDKDACVEMDLDMAKGISAEYLDSQIGLWTLVVARFADHVGFKK